MHASGIEVDKPRRVFLGLAVNEVERSAKKLLVHGLHTLGVERAGILYDLLADLSVRRIEGRIVLIDCFCLEDAASPNLVRKPGSLG